MVRNKFYFYCGDLKCWCYFFLLGEGVDKDNFFFCVQIVVIKIKFIVFDSVVLNGGKLFFKVEIVEFEYIGKLVNCNK